VLTKVDTAVQVEPVGQFELKGIRRPDVAPEDNAQHLPATSDVDAIADMALASELRRC
jgi:hypothetical protein